MPDSLALPNILLTLSVADAYALYAAGVADEAGRPTPPLTPPLAALPDGPDWLAAQQHLKAREV